MHSVAVNSEKKNLVFILTHKCVENVFQCFYIPIHRGNINVVLC